MEHGNNHVQSFQSVLETRNQSDTNIINTNTNVIFAGALYLLSDSAGPSWNCRTQKTACSPHQS